MLRASVLVLNVQYIIFQYRRLIPTMHVSCPNIGPCYPRHVTDVGGPLNRIFSLPLLSFSSLPCLFPPDTPARPSYRPCSYLRLVFPFFYQVVTSCVLRLCSLAFAAVFCLSRLSHPRALGATLRPPFFSSFSTPVGMEFLRRLPLLFFVFPSRPFLLCPKACFFFSAVLSAAPTPRVFPVLFLLWKKCRFSPDPFFFAGKNAVFSPTHSFLLRQDRVFPALQKPLVFS